MWRTAMNRAEKRRLLKKDKKTNTVTYNLTQAQLDAAIERGVRDKLNEMKSRVTEDAVNTAMALTLVLPMKVLMEHYWQNTYLKNLPEFADYLVNYYEKWQNDELDIYKMKEELWEYAGVRIEEDK